MGAARFLAGLVRTVPPEDVAVVVNTGDDMRFYGVHVSPDVDIVTYTLAGRVDRARGYGLEGDTTAVIEALGALGHETWFRLGDRDFALEMRIPGKEYSALCALAQQAPDRERLSLEHYLEWDGIADPQLAGEHAVGLERGFARLRHRRQVVRVHGRAPAEALGLLRRLAGVGEPLRAEVVGRAVGALERASVALESGKGGRFDQAKLVDTIAMDVWNSSKWFRYNIRRNQFAQRAEESGPHIAVSRQALDR